MNKPRILILESVHPAGEHALAESFTVVDGRAWERERVLAEAADCVAIVVKSVTRVDAQLLERAPGLRVVGRAGTGVDNIDLVLARARGIQVLTVPGGNAQSAAEFAVGQMLALVHRLYDARDGIVRRDFRRDLFAGRDLGAMTIGILGIGHVGGRVARLLRAFGARVIACDPTADDGEFLLLDVGRVASIDDMMPAIDILTLHCPLTPETRGLVDARRLAMARDGLIVINTARGEVVETNALLAALDSGKVGAAAVDVLAPEPPFYAEPGTHAYAHPLLDHPRVAVTPHMAASTSDAQKFIAVTLARKMLAALSPAPEAAHG